MRNKMILIEKAQQYYIVDLYIHKKINYIIIKYNT